MSILAPDPAIKPDSPVSTESFEIGEGRAYWGLKCLHTDRGATPYGHDSVYRFFDAEGRLLYVGHTFSILSRWVKHRRKPWWPEVRSATVACYYGEAAAREVEAAAIVTEAPLYNKARPARAPR